MAELPILEHQLRLEADPAERRGSLCDSPPTRLKSSRWQQLKAGWSNNISTADQDSASVHSSPEKQLLLQAVDNCSSWHTSYQQQQPSSSAAADTGVADVLKRCADLHHSLQQSSHAAAPASTALEADVSQLHIGPDGSLVWGTSGTPDAPHVAAGSLFELLQTDPSTILESLSSQHLVYNSVPRQESQQEPRAPLHSQQQQLDLTGVFDYLHSSQRHKQQKQKAPAATRRSKVPPNSSNYAASGSRQHAAGSITTGSKVALPSRGAVKVAAGRAQQQKQPARSPVLGRPATTSAAPAQHQQQQQLLSPGRGTFSNRRPGPVHAPAQGGRTVAVPAARAAAGVRPAAPGKAAAAGPLAGSSRVTGLNVPNTAPSSSTKASAVRPAKAAAAVVRTPAPVGKTAQGRGGQAAAPTAVEAHHTLQQELSSSSSSSLRECEAELRLELTAVLLFRLLRRWRLAAADMCVDRARARPMFNLLR